MAAIDWIENINNIPRPVYGPGILNKTILKILISQSDETRQNLATIIENDGTTRTMVGYIKDGNIYLDDGTNLIRIEDSGNDQGLYSKDDITDMKWENYYNEYGIGNTVEVTIELSGTRYIEPHDNIPFKPYIPSKPVFQTYDVPTPSFATDLENVTKYSYFFGLDKIKFIKTYANNNCCFISKEININKSSPEEYIQLKAEYVENDNSSIEFYIIDGGMEIPILPVDTKTILNEKIFYGLRPRFPIDMSKNITIKKNGIPVDISLDTAIQSNDASYTISYTPTSSYNIVPLNNTIKVKVIQRMYDKVFSAPYVKSMKIRKYGGNALWKEDISI